MVELVVPDWLRQRARTTPDRLALLRGASRWTFLDLDRQVDGAVALLAARGVARDQRIGLLAANSAGYAIAVHALMRLGAVIVPLNTRLAPAELEWQRRDARLVDCLDAADVDALARASQLAAPPAFAERLFELDAPHSVVYTSGTTGQPKGAVLTFGNHWWSAVGSALNLGVARDDRWLAVLPLFHVGGLSILLKSVIYGIAAEIHERFDAAAVNAAIDAGVTHVSVVSAMLGRMLDDRGERAYPRSLRCVLLGGGPAPRPLLERAFALDAPVVQTYGLTETASQIATLAPEDALRKLGSAGKPLIGSRLRIAADGEIWVAGPTVSPGYLHHPPRETDGWLGTGDLGYLDEDGYLYVLDRRDDLIISGGENVYPAEVEAALLAHPAVAEAGVYGVPDAEWGQAVAAAIVVRPATDVSAVDLIAFCRERLAGYKVPRRIETRASLPRNAAGKLLRRNLGPAGER